MRGQWTQFLILMIALGAPLVSWIFGKLREQAELKKARDDVRRRQEDLLRTTQLASRVPALSPEEQRERERRDLAARRQAQLRELRQRQHERGATPGTVVRGSGVARAPGAPPPMPQRPAARQAGPLRPGVPAPAGRRTPPAAAPGRPAPTRPMPAPARPVPIPTPRRPSVVQVPVGCPPVDERRPAPALSTIAATEIGQARPGEKPPRQRGVGAGVRGMLMRPEGRPRPREDLARAIALTEVLSAPIALRDEDQFSWNRV